MFGGTLMLIDAFIGISSGTTETDIEVGGVGLLTDRQPNRCYWGIIELKPFERYTVDFHDIGSCCVFFYR